MAEKLFIYLAQERQRLENAIAVAESSTALHLDNVRAGELRRLHVLHRTVNEQIAHWTRDLAGPENARSPSAA